MALWEPELALRIAHEKRPSTEALKVAVTEIAAGQELAFGALEVRVVAVDHQPVRHAFGFVFAGGGKTLVLSGDTRRCPALIAAARGADLLGPGEIGSTSCRERVFPYGLIAGVGGKLKKKKQH